MILSLIDEGDRAREGGNVPALTCQRIGPPLLFERLWRNTGCREVLHQLLADRRLRVSRRAGRLPHRAVPANGQVDRTLVARRMKDLVEERLFARRRSQFSDLSVVLMDTTSLYFEGEGGATLGERGHSKDCRPHLNQMIVGVIIDQEGRPVCSEMWPDNTADVSTLIPAAQPLRHRAGLRRRRSRHDQRRHHRRSGAARFGIHPRRARAQFQGSARGRHGRADAERATSDSAKRPTPNCGPRRSRSTAAVTSSAAIWPRPHGPPVPARRY